MLRRVLSFLEDQGYNEDSKMKQWEINKAFDKIISTQQNQRQFPRAVSNQIWQLTQKNQNNQVVLGQYLQNMENQNRLRHLLPESYIYSSGQQDAPQSQVNKPSTIKTQNDVQEDQFPTQYVSRQSVPNQTISATQSVPKREQQVKTKQQITQETPIRQLESVNNNYQPNIEQYSQRQSVQVRNVNLDGSVSANINATVAESVGTMGSLLGQDSLLIQQQIKNSNQRANIQQPKYQKVETLDHKKSSQTQNKPPKVQVQKLQQIIDDAAQQIPVKQKSQSKQNSQSEKISKKSQVKKPKGDKKKQKKRDSLKNPLLQYDYEPTEQQIQDSLISDIQRPALKPKSGQSIIKNKSTAQNTTKYSSSALLNKDQIQNQTLLNQKKKCMSKRWFIPICLFILGIMLFMGSFILHSQVKKLAKQQVVLKPQTQGIWAHFPGETNTQIDRNWTFFNITNPDQMLFYNQKPKFRQIKDFKIIELQDYINITYIDDGDRVQMIDWLHFAEQPESRSLDEKVKVLNIGGLAYWYNIKVARPTIILQQGLGLLFNTLQTSILQNIYAQAINVQFLPSQWNQDIYAQIFAPVEISFDQAWFIWSDPAYGMGNQNNLKYWIEALNSNDDDQNQTVSDGFNFLLDYFTLSLEQMKFIQNKFESYVQFAASSVLQNAYCYSQQSCTGRFLAYQQFSTSYVTRNPPPSGKPIQPNDTICLSNTTCTGFYPQLSAYYNNVYIQRNPDKNKTLAFDPQWMKNVVNYNASIDKHLDYNTAQNCLFHIGNLDALWDNGTLYDTTKDQTYLINIQKRFGLLSPQHAHVFWSWTKYLNNQFVLQNHTNQQLGVANLFANGLYQGFSYLQDNLQSKLLVDLIYYDLTTQSVGDCSTFIASSFGLQNTDKALKICDKYGQKITPKLVQNLLSFCTNQFKQGWNMFYHGYNLTLFQLANLCQFDQQQNGSFGFFLHNRRKYINDRYNCQITPKQYCSDYQLAAIQWSTSKVTLNPPPQLNLSANHTYKAWDKNASRFQYTFYTSKYPNDSDFPSISIKQAYGLLNFDNWFSAPVVLKEFTNQTYNEKLKAYMRFVGLQVGLNGLTMERTARELIFGYKDQILEGVKNSYPPFGGDPSTPSLIAFNDPNITKQEATMTLQWSTGKSDSSLVSQYRKINGKQYLTIQKDFFNGNYTTTFLQSPWQGQDYVYGTSAKQFSPDQFDQPNISLYVPNIQRYGSGQCDPSITEQRFGFEVQFGYLGQSIMQSTQQSDLNKKYYQSFFAIFNETSVVGFPLFVTKNHFMNVSSNWTQLVQIYNENGTFQYVNASKYDDSFVVVQPYTGLSFQSTIYLQSNYYHTPDALLNFYNRSLLPIFSLARSGNITQNFINDKLTPLKIGIAAVQWIRIIGIIIIVISAIICGIIYYKKKKAQKSQPQHSQDDHNTTQNDTKTKENNVMKSSQLGISMQPMTRQTNQQKTQYIPPPVIEQQV